MSNPTYIPEPFAANADPAYVNTIPETTATPGRASLDLGFPPITMTPVVSGGIPPQGQDMNGILKLVSEHTVFQQAGGLYNFSQTWIDDGNVYGLGALILSDDGTTVYQSSSAVNDTNPNSDSLAAGWTVVAFTAGIQTIAVGTGGAIPLGLNTAAAPILVFTGAPSAPMTITLPRHQSRQWLIVNATTGGQTMTVKTAAPGSLSVTIPAGGFSGPTGVYSDGVNVFLAVTPLGVAIDQAAAPLTLVERTNTGDVWANYFHSGEGVETPAIGSVLVENVAADGFLRKTGLANLAAALLAAPGNILNNAALTGAPTTNTPALGTQNTRLATTAFANPANSQAANGFIQFPSGLILQWGFAQGAAGPGSTAVAFPEAFPNACFAAVCSTANRTGSGSAGYNFVNALSVNGFTAWFDVQQSGGGTGLRGGYWFAIGN
jgi:hypothetical protein